MAICDIWLLGKAVFSSTEDFNYRLHRCWGRTLKEMTFSFCSNAQVRSVFMVKSLQLMSAQPSLLKVLRMHLHSQIWDGCVDRCNR